MLGIKPPKISGEIDARSEAALVPHYAFVRTLTALAAGLLGLSAPQVTAIGAVADPFREKISVWAMLCLGSAIVFGAVALHGEVNIHLAAIRWYLALLEKYKGNQDAACEEAERHGIITPPKYHIAAFFVQCLSLFIGVVLLVWSKFPTSHPVSFAPPLSVQTQTPAPKKGP